jgi:phage N-6-adenine-methyltransferase
MNQALLSSEKHDWQTPDCVLKLVRVVAGGEIALDPCTTADNPCEAEEVITPEEDGLELPWDTLGLVYVNPPYGAIKTWAEKILEESIDAEIIALVPARTETKWFCQLVWEGADACCFWKGRLTFKGAPSSAPFPSAVAYYGPRPAFFEYVFARAGRVVRL